MMILNNTADILFLKIVLKYESDEKYIDTFLLDYYVNDHIIASPIISDFDIIDINHDDNIVIIKVKLKLPKYCNKKTMSNPCETKLIISIPSYNMISMDRYSV